MDHLRTVGEQHAAVIRIQQKPVDDRRYEAPHLHVVEEHIAIGFAERLQTEGALRRCVDSHCGLDARPVAFSSDGLSRSYGPTADGERDPTACAIASVTHGLALDPAANHVPARRQSDFLGQARVVAKLVTVRQVCTARPGPWADLGRRKVVRGAAAPGRGQPCRLHLFERAVAQEIGILGEARELCQSARTGSGRNR